MRVLVATDGSTDVEAAAKFALALAGGEGATTVATIVHIPRQLLPELRAQWNFPEPPRIEADPGQVGVLYAADSVPRGWPGDDAMIDQYLGNKRDENCGPIADAIRRLGGSAAPLAIEGTDATDKIMAIAAEIDADVIVVGSHGHGAFQGLLGSTGSKLVRRADRPVVVLR